MIKKGKMKDLKNRKKDKVKRFRNNADEDSDEDPGKNKTG